MLSTSFANYNREIRKPCGRKRDAMIADLNTKKYYSQIHMADRIKRICKVMPPEGLKPPLLPGEEIPLFERDELREYKVGLERLNQISNEVFQNVNKVN